MEPTSKKRRGCLIPFLVIIGVFMATIIGIAIGVSSSEKTVQKGLLAKAMDLTEEQEEAMLAVFDACGVVEIEEVTQFHAGENQTSYHIRDEETKVYSGMRGNIVVWVSNSSKTVEAIYYNDEGIYVNGVVTAQISDYYVSRAQRDSYRVVAQQMVEQCLSYPDTAKFGSVSAWNFGVQDGCDIILSSVTAKNAFGMESTEQFQLKIDRESGVPISLIIGNTEYIN